MKRFGLLTAVLVLLGMFTALFPPLTRADTLPGLPAPVKKVVDRLDVPVVSGKVKRSWTWGEYFATQNEPYQESPGGNRAVYYFDKGRLEINNPGADPNNEFYATSGLLLREMITGQVQVGDSALQNREPADVPLAGDNPPLVADAPTYASLRELVSFDGSWKSSDLTGKIAGMTLKKGGAVDSSMTGLSQVKYAAYDPATGHNVVDVFLNFMNSSGLVLENNRLVTAPLYNALYVFGHPISEAYWANVTVAGKQQWVLTQAFERRLLTYTPGNSPEFQVELGNIGRAYYQWRYGQPGAVPATDPGVEVPAETPGLQLYNHTATNMNSVRALKVDTLLGNTKVMTTEYSAPNRKRETQYGTVNGQPATLVDIYIENRIYEAIFVNGKLATPWVFVEVPISFKWPDYQQITPNDASIDFKIGADSKVGTEPSHTLVNSEVDLNGSNLTQTRFISAVTGVSLMRVDVMEQGGKSATQTLKYLNYNQPIAIDAPPNAQPYLPSVVPTPMPQASFITPVEYSGEGVSLKQLVASYTRPIAAAGEVVVKFKDSAVNAQAVLSESGFAAQNFKADGQLSIFKVSPESVEATVSRLNADPRVEYAEPNYLYYSQDVIAPNDAGYAQEYHLKVVKAPRAWSITTGGDVQLAVVDSGTDVNHPDLKPNVIGSFDLVDGKFPADGPDGHGTLVAGVATAIGNNGDFGAGVAWHSKLVTYRVLGEEGGTSADVAKGIRAATDGGAKVINMSLGGYSASKTIEDAIAYAHSKGVILVAAAGNTPTDKPSYPAAYPGVISVSATGKLGLPTSFTSFGDTVTLAAPGVGVCGTIRTGKFGCADGTSFSSPTVAGAIVLMLSVNPNLTADQVKAILVNTATPAPGLQTGQHDPKYGYGTLNVYAAVRAAATNQFPALPQGIRP